MHDKGSYKADSWVFIKVVQRTFLKSIKTHTNYGANLKNVINKNGSIYKSQIISLFQHVIIHVHY
jgi:hypothetical protein